ncbi:MAG: hypothetical protein EOO24_17750, partial [Comamonadaceae bacterium]
MPSSRPLASDLLAIVQEYLSAEVSPLLPAAQQFQLKIVSRVLSTVTRELEFGPRADAEELARLRSLLDRSGSADELNAALARAIRAGDFTVDDPVLRAHLR